MQIDPIKPTLKAPGIKLLNLKYDKPLSHFAFKFNLRRYIEVLESATISLAEVPEGTDSLVMACTNFTDTSFNVLEMVRCRVVGRCRLTLSNPRWNRLELSACNWSVMNCFRVLLSNSTCAGTAWWTSPTARAPPSETW